MNDYDDLGDNFEEREEDEYFEEEEEIDGDDENVDIITDGELKADSKANKMKAPE